MTNSQPLYPSFISIEDYTDYMPSVREEGHQQSPKGF